MKLEIKDRLFFFILFHFSYAQSKKLAYNNLMRELKS